VVALVPRRALAAGALAADLPTWGDNAGLCPDEPFSDQPAAAFCTGVLANWDLVLTAGHCGLVLAPADVVVVFGYFYLQRGQLALIPADIHGMQAVVSESLGESDERPRLDFSWLRLDRPAAPPREPAPLRRSNVERGSPLVFAGSGGASPSRWTRGRRSSTPAWGPAWGVLRA
jgi:hypothetical protein